MNLRSHGARRASRRFATEVGALDARTLLSSDVLTYHNDNARSGLNAGETTLAPGNVNASTFGKLFVDAVDGKVDAQPLYKAGVAIPGQGTHNVLFVATEHDSVYAFDADTGAKLWQASMLGAGEVPSDPVYGNQVTPEIGVTATPVIDAQSGTIYVVAMSKLVSGGSTTYIQRIHGLDIATGGDRIAPHSIDSSVTFPGAGPGGNGTSVIFNPKQYKERDALILVNGVVYTFWASHSDVAPYTGWIIGFDANRLGVSSVLNVDPNGLPRSSYLQDGSGNAFWNSGAGPDADAAGNLYNLVSNGPFDTNLNAAGFPTNGDYGDSFIRLTPSGGSLGVSDYFAPYNQQNLANGDEDIGSSGLTLVDVPDAAGATRHLAVGSGKDGNIYVVDRDAMGKFHSTTNAIYQELPGALGGAEYGAPVAFNGEVYFGAVGATLRAFRFVGGKLQVAPASQTGNTFGYPGTTPVISANGATGGIVWAAENGGTAVLHAYDASDLSKELYNSNQAANGRDHFGAGNKFITPTVAGGKVFVATTNGVGVFGLLAAGTPPTVAQAASATPNPVAGTTTNLAVLGADANDPESALTYTWATTAGPSGVAAPGFSVNGTNAAKSTVATFHGAGRYTFQVTIADPAHSSATGAVDVVVNQTATAVTVSPASATVVDGGMQAFTASVADQFGVTIASPPTVAWSLAPGGVGSISATGLYSAPTSGTGSATVKAASGSATGSATVQVSASAGFSAHINFTADPATVPAGYVDDIGLAYAARGNGLTFGWNADNTANARDRDVPSSPDERYDTFLHLQKPSDPNTYWTIAVPNGTYTVHLIAGDPSFVDSVFKTSVNGVLALSGTSSASRHWVEGTAAVTVTNGRLVVSNAPGAQNNKIDAIDITPAAVPGRIVPRTVPESVPGIIDLNPAFVPVSGVPRTPTRPVAVPRGPWALPYFWGWARHRA